MTMAAGAVVVVAVGPLLPRGPTSLIADFSSGYGPAAQRPSDTSQYSAEPAERGYSFHLPTGYMNQDEHQGERPFSAEYNLFSCAMLRPELSPSSFFRSHYPLNFFFPYYTLYAIFLELSSSC